MALDINKLLACRKKTYDQHQVMGGYTLGYDVEFRLRTGSDEWAETKFPQWNWVDVDYRIKVKLCD